MFNRLKTYTIHTKPGVENVETVPEGFSLGAFLFGPLWFFYQRSWIVGVVVLLVVFIAAALVAAFGVTSEAAAMLQLALWFCIAVGAQDFRRLELRIKGYQETDVVTADAPTKALLRFFDRKNNCNTAY